MRAESGGGQHGLSFDNRGRKFVCSNSSHVQTLMYEERYAARNPFYTMPRALVDIAVDGGAAEVFRISPDEPWRVIRTQWRVSGLVPGPIEGGGRPSGYFTGATGITIYRGDGFGPDFVGDAFVGDAGGNLVHRKKILPDGVGVKAIRPTDEQNVEFLASTDTWFRPVQMANAPDGCLYICDMYREVIEHPWSLPDSIKKHLDLNSGNDRGRIYRIVPEKFKQPRLPRLSKASTKKLVAMLTLANGWHRDTAARLLYQRQPKAAIPALTELVTNSPVPMIRVQALYSLSGLNALNEKLALTALENNKLPEVRTHVIRLSEKILEQQRDSGSLLQKLVALGGDRDDEVLRQLAFTLGTLPRATRIEVAVAYAKRYSTRIYREIVACSVGEEAGEIFQKLAAADTWLIVAPCYETLFFLIGAYNRSQEVDAALNALATAVLAGEKRKAELGVDGESLLLFAANLARGLERGGSSLNKYADQDRLKPIFALARQWATQPEAEPTRFNSVGAPIKIRRGDAVTLLGYAAKESATPALLDVVERYPQFATEALAALSHQSTLEVTTNLLARWPRLAPGTRKEVIAALLKRTENAKVLLAAMTSGPLRREDFSTAQIEFLRSHRDPVVRAEATRLLTRDNTATRQAVFDALKGALSLRGSPEKGKMLFDARCATCHQMHGRGHALGPDLATVKNAGKEKILVNILDPNREVNPNYLSYLVETKDGESLTGLIINESANSVTLRMAGGAESVVARANIASMQSQGKSLMPEGLEEGLSQQDMADLLEFIVATP